MWETFGDRTITVMARGTRYLTQIWQAAWDSGGGDGKIAAGDPAKPADLQKLYNNPNVVPSVALDQYPADRDADWSTIKRSAAGQPANGS